MLYAIMHNTTDNSHIVEMQPESGEIFPPVKIAEFWGPKSLEFAKLVFAEVGRPKEPEIAASALEEPQADPTPNDTGIDAA